MSGLQLYGYLFATQIWIGTFTFGGGYVVLPMMEKYYAGAKGLLTEEELAELAAIAQSSPGAIAVNLAVLAGWRIAGMKGALVSGAASLLPSLVILSAVSACYEAVAASRVAAHALKGMQAGVCAVILSCLVDLVRRMKKTAAPFYLCMIPAVFLASTVLRIPAVLILAGCCILCIFKTVFDAVKIKKFR